MVRLVTGVRQLPTSRIPAQRSSRSKQFAVFLRALVRDRVTFAAVSFLFLVLTSAILAEALVDIGILRDPNAQNLLIRNSPPGIAADGTFRILGTDQLGRDELSRIVFGARVSLSVGFATVSISGMVGIVLGLLAGYFSGWVDDGLMRLVDIQMGFPTLVLALAVLYVAGSGFRNLVLVLALTQWPVIARVTRGQTLSLRECEFVLGAHSIGATNLRIMRRHMLPNLLSPVLVVGTLQFASAMLTEAALSFLGVGIQPPESSWGLMLAQGRPYITTAWWLVAFPGLAIMLTTLSVNLLASWMRGITDPAQRWRWLQKEC
jgi:peptide/nickel transport system permease protein